ncbi:restriction endonuclease [Bacillus sp. JJ1609]|uniref:restriction endonuclease n=1 Tax=Bacillus sp. JJ1609 TaxID=3122977 RepID=UPI002FFE2363
MEFYEGFKMGLELLWSILTADPLFTAILLLFFGGALLFAFVTNLLREQKLRKSGILEIDHMPGRKFEEYLQALLKVRGYSVILTPASGDYGADLILTAKGKKIVVQAKRYKKKVGVKAVQEVASAKSHYQADECWVITNSYFTEQAKKLAQSNQVMLIDRKTLINWMLEQKGA